MNKVKKIDLSISIRQHMDMSQVAVWVHDASGLSPTMLWWVGNLGHMFSFVHYLCPFVSSPCVPACI